MWWPSNVGSMGLPDNVAKTRMCVCVCVLSEVFCIVGG